MRLTSDLQRAGVAQQEAVLGQRQQASVLVPAHGGSRVSSHGALQYRHAADRQSLVLRSVMDDRRRAYVGVCIHINDPRNVIITSAKDDVFSLALVTR